MSRAILDRIAAGLVLAISGCGSAEPTEPGSGGVSVRLDKTVYSFARDVEVRSTVYNRRSNPLYVPMGEYVHLEQWSDNGWIYRGPWFFVDGFGPSFPVPPGDSLVTSMDLRYVNRAGTYRFVFRLWLHPRGRWQVPEEERVAEFTVVWE
jgi:hypothetical protein